MHVIHYYLQTVDELLLLCVLIFLFMSSDVFTTHARWYSLTDDARDLTRKRHLEKRPENRVRLRKKTLAYCISACVKHIVCPNTSLWVAYFLHTWVNTCVVRDWQLLWRQVLGDAAADDAVDRLAPSGRHEAQAARPAPGHAALAQWRQQQRRRQWRQRSRHGCVTWLVFAGDDDLRSLTVHI